MANNVTVHVTGSDSQILQDVQTVGDVKRELGLETYTAVADGAPAKDETRLNDFSQVVLSASSKGGR